MSVEKLPNSPQPLYFQYAKSVMAEGKDTSLKELEEEITCAICHDHYTEPKVLSCCHYYCKQCILRLALRTGLDKPFSCPECRKDTTLPEGNVDKLQGAFFINRMKQVHSSFCRQCAQFICAECVKSHKRMKKAFPGHKIVTLDELKEGGAKEIVVQEPTLQTCKQHKDPMKMYCFDCGCLICRDCTIIDHQGHKYEFIKKAAPATKEKLSQHLEPLRQTRETLSCAVRIYTKINKNFLGSRQKPFGKRLLPAAQKAFINFCVYPVMAWQRIQIDHAHVWAHAPASLPN